MCDQASANENGRKKLTTEVKIGKRQWDSWSRIREKPKKSCTFLATV
jgi:hypothetical protein